MSSTEPVSVGVRAQVRASCSMWDPCAWHLSVRQLGTAWNLAGGPGWPQQWAPHWRQWALEGIEEGQTWLNAHQGEAHPRETDVRPTRLCLAFREARQTWVGWVFVSQCFFLDCPSVFRRTKLLTSSCAWNLISAKHLGNAWMVPTSLPL